MVQVTYPLDEAQKNHKRRRIQEAAGVALVLILLIGAIRYFTGQNVVSPVLSEKETRVLAERDHREARDTIAQTVEDLQLKVTALENQLVSSVTYSYPQATSFTGTNLLRNSSYESAEGGKPRQWSYMYDATTENTRQSNEGIRSGSYGLKFSGAASGSTTASIAYGGLDLGVSQPETETVPGRTYTLSLFIKHTNIEGGAYIRFGFWDKYHNRFGPMKTVPLNGTKDWTRISATVTTTGLITDNANWYPMIEVRRLGEGAAVYIDDVQLEEGSTLTLYNSSVAGGTRNSFTSGIGDGSILGTPTGEFYPAQDGVGSLGKSSNRWHDLYLSKATINENGDLDLTGTASVGNLTVNGNSTLTGNVTIQGTTTFSELSDFTSGISVGTDGQFSINAQGDITKIKGVSYSFPSSQGAVNSLLMNDGAGDLSWGTLGAASVTADSLDFAQIVDGMTLDADTSINLYDGTARNLRFYNANSGTEMLFLNGSIGQIGIGTTNPTKGQLELSSGVTLGADSTAKILIDGTSATPTSGEVATFANSGSLFLASRHRVEINIDNDANSSGQWFAITHDAGTVNATGSYLFYVSENGRVTVGGTEGTGSGSLYTGSLYTGTTLRMDSSGNLSNIGTVSSGSLTSSGTLTVNGAGNSYLSGNVGIGTTGPGRKVQIVDTSNDVQLKLGDGSRDVALEMSSGSTTQEAIRFASGGTFALANNTIRVGSGHVGINTSASAFLDVLATGNPEDLLRLGASTQGDRFVVTKAGNVGIGTTNPRGLLDMFNGNAYIGNLTYYLQLGLASNIPTIFGQGAYLRIGDAGTASTTGADSGALVDSEDDLFVSGNFQVGGSFRTPYAQTITVAKSGGDFTTINAAYTFAKTLTPSATNRVLIKVMPGVYTERLTLDTSYISIIGSGRENTKMTYGSGSAATLYSASAITGVEIAHLTIEWTTVTGGAYTVQLTSANPAIYLHHTSIVDATFFFGLFNQSTNAIFEYNVISGDRSYTTGGNFRFNDIQRTIDVSGGATLYANQISNLIANSALARYVDNVLLGGGNLTAGLFKYSTKKCYGIAPIMERVIFGVRL